MKLILILMFVVGCGDGNEPTLDATIPLDVANDAQLPTCSSLGCPGDVICTGGEDPRCICMGQECEPEMP